MLSGPVIIMVAFLYLGLLFAIAYYGDKRADQGRSLIANPSIYALSIAVYCTSWTFYGWVGRAASSGVDFLPIYLGPTLTFILGWSVIRKIIRISKVNRTTSIADFIASRYGKSSSSARSSPSSPWSAFFPTSRCSSKRSRRASRCCCTIPSVVLPDASGQHLLPAGHRILRGLAHGRVRDPVRHASHRCERAARGHGGGDRVRVGGQARRVPCRRPVRDVRPLRRLRRHLRARRGLRSAQPAAHDFDGVAQHTSWITLTLLAMAAIVVLPRQFQVMVVENVDERHLEEGDLAVSALPPAHQHLRAADRVRRAADLPAGRRRRRYLRAHHSAARRQPLIALIAFIGGLSAGNRHDHRRDGRARHHGVQRSGHAAAAARRPPASLRAPRPRRHPARIRRDHHHSVCCSAMLYVRLIGESYALVTIGLVSFAAVDQFVPAIVGGIYWKGATRAGAAAGLTGGFLSWIYTLLLPSFARSGWIADEFHRERSARARGAQAVCAVRAHRGSTRSRTPRSGPCWSMSGSSSAFRC